jgi:hypothetical protein
MIDDPSSAGDSYGDCPQKEAHGQFIRSERTQFSLSVPE